MRMLHKFLIEFCVFDFFIVFLIFSCFFCLFRCIFFLSCVRLCIVWILCLYFLFLLWWIHGVSCFVLCVQMVVLLFLIVFCRFFVPSLFPFSIAFWFWKGFHSLGLFCSSFSCSRFLSLCSFCIRLSNRLFFVCFCIRMFFFYIKFLPKDRYMFQFLHLRRNCLFGMVFPTNYIFFLFLRVF